MRESSVVDAYGMVRMQCDGLHSLRCLSLLVDGVNERVVEDECAHDDDGKKHVTVQHIGITVSR